MFVDDVVTKKALVQGRWHHCFILPRYVTSYALDEIEHSGWAFEHLVMCLMTAELMSCWFCQAYTRGYWINYPSSRVHNVNTKSS